MGGQPHLVADLIGAQERERARIAAGVHDDSLQAMTTVALRLQRLRRRLTDPDMLRMVAELEESVELAADRLRRLIFDLRPPALERCGLAAALRDALARLHEDRGVQPVLHDRLRNEPPLPTRVQLYRIVQEALFNVGAHAKATRVEVTLTEQDGGYQAEVTDDGIGFSAISETSEPGHLGLSLMRERAELSGGWLRVHSAPGSGTRVTVWLPRSDHGDELAAYLTNGGPPSHTPCEHANGRVTNGRHYRDRSGAR